MARLDRKIEIAPRPKADTGNRSAAQQSDSKRPNRARRPGVPQGAGASKGATQRRFLAAGLSMSMVCLGVTHGVANTLAEVRIARCQELVRRQSDSAEILPASWRIWDDPVPNEELPAAALGKIKAHDLLYDGGIGGLFKLKTATATGQAREVFAFCSYDNLFVWLQGIYDSGVWTQFNAADYIAPY